MILKPPNFPISPSPTSRPLPALLFLRVLCGLHLLLAALLPASNHFSLLLIQTSPLQIPLLLFLSGFTTLHAHAPSHLSKSFSASHFYVRRFAHLIPLYLLSLILQPLLTPTAPGLPFLQPLSPFLPSSLTYAPSISPLLSQTFLPSLFLSYLIFPVLLDLFPRYTSSKPVHLFYLILSIYLTTLLQSFWLSHLPDTPESRRSLMLFDLAVFIPFLANLPSFITGMLLALLFLSRQHTPSPPLSKLLRLQHVFLAALFLLLSSSLVLPWALTPPAADGSQSFFQNFLVCGALLPAFASLVWTCASLSDPSYESVIAHHMPRRLFVTLFPIDSPALLCASSYFYTIYVLAAPVWRILGLTFCRDNGVDASAISVPIWQHLICVRAVEKDAHLPPTWSWWPWSAGNEDLSLSNAALASAERLVNPTRFVGAGVSLVLYVGILMIVSWGICRWVQMPIAGGLIGVHARLTRMAEEGTLAEVSSLWSRVAALLLADPSQGKPRRNNSAIERVMRVTIYYIGLAWFLRFVFRFSLPISFHLTAAKPGSLFCWLPNVMYNCAEGKEKGQLSGLLGAFGIGSRVLTNVVDVLRWVALLTLPPMLLNLIGHIVFPRAIWKKLPTISQMWRNKISRDEEAPEEELAEKHCNGFLNALDETTDERYSPPCKELDLDFVLFIRYVTRGTNPRMVVNNARRAAEILVETGLPKSMWRVEVVTDNKLNLDMQIADPSVCEIVVPSSYHPPNGALYKARALNYAISASPARPMDWIVHLDEETRFDTDTIRAVLYHCGRETYLTRVAKSQEWPRIGQGPILYGRSMGDSSIAGGDIGSGNWLTTLADSGRVSDDCGRYRLQYECGEVWVGMHGSFVVAANCVEQAVTFDHGVEGSIAEDAYFALLARARDVRFAWIDALMFEQSPFTIIDFIKQRSRWLVGGLKVVNSENIPLRWRFLMKILTGLWSLMPLTYSALIVSLLFGSSGLEGSRQNWYFFQVLLPVLAAISLWNYVFGFFMTFSIRRIGVFRFVVLLYMQIILTPVFGIMEVAAVSYALWNFTKLSVGFYVVEKDHAVEMGKGGKKVGMADERTRLL